MKTILFWRLLRYYLLFRFFKTKFFTNCCNTYQNQNNLTSNKLKSITFTRCRSQVIIASRHIPFGSSLSVYSRWRPTEGVEACVGGSIVGITPGAALTSNQLSDAILYWSMSLAVRCVASLAALSRYLNVDKWLWPCTLDRQLVFVFFSVILLYMVKRSKMALGYCVI